MGTLVEYIDWRGDLRFSEVGLCEVDSLILSMIAYVNFDGIVPPPDDEGGSVTLLEAIRTYTRENRGKRASMGRFIPADLLNLAIRAAKSRRYRGIRLSRYVNDIDEEEQKQFCALTFRITKNEYFIAFRGTDDTLVGWKESFNMSFMRPIPAQIEAAKYFAETGRVIDGTFFLGGHSKGGNLAVYASVEAETSLRERIINIFNNDGPGFDREYIDSEGYQSIKDKIRTIVPQSSVVGMLLEHEENYEVIKSAAGGLLQHTGHTWEVMGGSFIHLDTVTEDSRLIDIKLKEWLNEMTPEERAAFVDTIYETVTSTNARTLTELSSERLKLVKAWNSLDQKTKSVLLKCISILIKHNAISIKIK